MITGSKGSRSAVSGQAACSLISLLGCWGLRLLSRARPLREQLAANTGRGKQTGPAQT